MSAVLKVRAVFLLEYRLSFVLRLPSYAVQNILLVEDVPLNAEIATKLTIWAETGEDALSFVYTEDDLDSFT